MAMRRMLFVAFLLPLSVTTLAQEQVTTADDQVKEGKPKEEVQATADDQVKEGKPMREVQVKGHRQKGPVTMQTSNSLMQFIADLKLQRKYSPSGLMGEKVNDYITHPFGFKERKVKKIRKRRQKILREFDAASDFNLERHQRELDNQKHIQLQP